MLTPGVIYKNSKPKLLQADVKGDIGGIRELIIDFIANAKGGEVKAASDKSWKIAGANWDEALHTKAMWRLAHGKLKIWEPTDDRHLINRAVRAEDLK